MSLKAKLISAISLFMLMIGVLIIGVYAATQQQLTMQGSVSFNVPDKSLYVKNVRYKEAGGEAIDIESFIPGYINGEFALDLSSLNTIENNHSTFSLYFDIINATDIQWTITDVELSEELESSGVTAKYSGVISTNDLTDANDDGLKDFDPATTLTDGTLELTVIAPNSSEIDLSQITIIINEYIPLEYVGFNFTTTSDNTAELASYSGTESDVDIPESFSIMAVDTGVAGYTETFNNMDEFEAYMNNEINQIILPLGFYYMTTPISGRTFVTNFESYFAELGTLAGNDPTKLFPMTIETVNYEIITYEDFASLGEVAEYGIIKPIYDVLYGKVGGVTMEFNSGEKYDISSANVEDIGNEIMSSNFTENNFPIKVSYPTERTMYVEGDDYTLTSIGDFAFWNCSGLTSITIPEGVTSIGNRAFYGCSGLESITFNTPYSWQISSSSSFSSILATLDASSVQANALTYLTDTYDNRYWRAVV